MRGGLDETLARLARREEAMRRRGTDPAAEGDTVPLPGTDAAGRRDGEPGRGEPARNAGPAWPDSHDGGPARSAGQHRADPPGRDPVEEVVEAVRRVVERYPELAVALRVEHGGRVFPLRVARSGGDVTVTAEPSAVPPPWPLSAHTVPAWSDRDGLDPDPAARLAELIRHDPSLLDGEPSW
ncbi:hypothetical protein [Micromonospora sp. NPDC126480]|uniref:hypothetical protein n=1 Tax=Micromonospora sp. NPDC126480 TaxID=3155312 RepID=UPI00332A2440